MERSLRIWSTATVDELLPSYRPAAVRSAATTAKTTAVAGAAVGRVALIDVSRGLFLFWMLTVHSLSLANVRSSSPLALLIPPSTFWLSERFVMLSGFTIAWVFAEKLLAPGASGWKLYRRAIQVGLIAIFSNLLALVIIDAASGHLAWTAFGDAILGRRPWSISWILVPTTLLLAASPWLLRFGHAAGATTFLVLATIAGVLTHGLFKPVLESWTSSSLHAGISLNPGGVISVAVLGIWGLALAFWARQFSLTRFAAVFAAASLVAVAVAQFIPLPTFLTATARFGVFFGTGLLVVVAPLPVVVPNLLALLGRNALLVFVAHRVYLQVSNRILVGKVDAESAGVIMAITVVAAMLVMCAQRQANPRVSAALKRVGL